MSNELVRVTDNGEEFEAQDADLEVARLMEEEGIGPREILKQIKELLSADASKLVDVDENGLFKLKVKMNSKHARGLIELSPTKIKMVDKVQLLKLATETARLLPKKAAAKTVVNDNRRQAVIALPPVTPKVQAFAGLIEAELVE